MNIRKYIYGIPTCILMVSSLNIPNAMAKIDLLGVMKSILNVPGKAINEVSNHNFNKDNLYFGANAGAIRFTERNLNVGASSEVALGLTFAANFSAEIHLDTGYSAGGIIGYHFSDFLDIEIEGTYAEATYSDADWLATATVTGSGGAYTATVGGNATIDGQKKLWGLLISPVIHPVRNEKYALYMGAGLGFKRLKEDIDSIDGNETLAIHESDLHLAGKAQAGLSYKITDNLIITPRYSLEWMNNDWGPLEDDVWHEFSINLKSEF